MFRGPLFEEKKEKSYVVGLVAFPFSPRENRNRGRDPFNQNFRKFRSKTQWIGSVQPEKFRKNRSSFWGSPLFPVGPVGILPRVVQPTNLKANTHQWISSRDPLAYNMQLKIDSNHPEGWFPLTRYFLAKYGNARN